MDEGIRREELAVHVRRSHVFEDSFRELHRRNADEWKNRFYIVFEGNIRILNLLRIVSIFRTTLDLTNFKRRFLIQKARKVKMREVC